MLSERQTTHQADTGKANIGEKKQATRHRQNDFPLKLSGRRKKLKKELRNKTMPSRNQTINMIIFVAIYTSEASLINLINYVIHLAFYFIFYVVWRHSSVYLTSKKGTKHQPTSYTYSQGKCSSSWFGCLLFGRWNIKEVQNTGTFFPLKTFNIYVRMYRYLESRRDGNDQLIQYSVK